MEESKPETEAETETAAQKYCIYTVTRASKKLVTALKINDTLCMPCPGDEKCRGKVGIPLNQLVVDAKGNKERIQMQLRNAKCTACPVGGKKGYTFGSTAGDVC